MAFTLETGDQVAGSNAYISIAAFVAYQTDRGRTYGTQTETELEQAVVMATDYIDKRFAARFRGTKAGTVQGTQWPRNSAMDNDGRTMTGIPDALLRAAAEYTYIVLTLGTELAPIPSDYAGKISEEKIGPITTKYAPGTKPMTSTGNMSQHIPEYPEADMWIEQLVQGRGSRRLARA